MNEQALWILSLQEWLASIPGALPLLKALTLLGNEEFFLLLLPFVYLCVNQRLGARLGLILLTCDVLVNLAKVLCALPRPYWLDPRLQLSTESSYGLPSGHAQNGTAVWLFLAASIRRRAAFVGAAVLVLLISFSRVALGVHFPTDVVGGWFLGALVLLGFWKLSPTLESWFVRLPLVRQVLVATLVVVTIFILRGAIEVLYQPSATVWRGYEVEARSWQPLVARSGALWGLLIGVSWARRVARFDVSEFASRKLMCFVIALLGVLLCWRGLAAIFPREPETVALCFRFVRYALMTLWVTLWAPLLFLRWRWLSPRGVAV